MIGNDFQQRREYITKLVKEIEQLCEGLPNNVDKKGFQKAVKNLEHYKFNLFIVGEAKAGKSTLINALIGKEVLPTGPLQCSSAIIEICCSKDDQDFWVEIRYADNHEERKEFEWSDDDRQEFAELIRKVGSVQEKYSKIPATSVDSYIVDHQHELDNAGKVVKDNLPIDEWFLESDLLRDDSAESLLDEYLSERSLGDIPTAITIGTWFKGTIFDGFRIIDSPGIGAVGGVQNITFNRIKEADSILFAHSLVEKVESKTLSNFIKEHAPEKHEKPIYLVLTKRNVVELEDDVIVKVEAAQNYCRGSIEKNHVFNTDSIARLTLHDIQNQQENDIETLRETYRSRVEKYEAKVSNKSNQYGEKALIKRKLKLLDDTIRAYPNLRSDQLKAKITEVANFGDLEEVINELITQSSDIIIQKILKMLHFGCREIINQIDDDINLHAKKIKDPQIFENEINHRNKKLKAYINEIEKFIEDVRSSYIGVHQVQRKEFDRIKSNFDEVYKKIKSDTSYRELLPYQTEKYIQKIYIAYSYALNKYQKDLKSLIQANTTKIKHAFIEEQKRLNLKNERDENPIRFPNIDVVSLEIYAIEKIYQLANLDRDPDGILENIASFFGYRYKKFDEKSFHKNIYDWIKKQINELDSHTQDATKNYIDLFADPFKKKVYAVVNERIEAIEKIKQSKISNQQINKKIEGKIQLKEELHKRLDRINELKVNFE